MLCHCNECTKNFSSQSNGSFLDQVYANAVALGMSTKTMTFQKWENNFFSTENGMT